MYANNLFLEQSGPNTFPIWEEVVWRLEKRRNRGDTPGGVLVVDTVEILAYYSYAHLSRLFL